jgi:phage repressor protein C with HTH and peptisase S24 domain
MAINKQMSAKSDPAARLRAAREAAGFKSASDAAQRFRWRASTYMAHENGQNGIRAPEPALTYARVYGVDLNWLLTGIGHGPRAGRPEAAQRGERQRSSRASQGLRETGTAPVDALYSAERWPRDLRVLGMAECGPDGWSLWNGEVIEMTSRPLNLAGAALAYAVYVVGDSMEPRYHSGELVYVHPGRPVDVGAYVLVQVKPKEDGDAPRAVVKRLVRRSATKVTLEQFNPKKTIELKASDVLSMHRVVGSGEA